MIDHNWTPSDEDFPAASEIVPDSTPEPETVFPAIPAENPAQQLTPIICWRCGKLAATSHRMCPYCGATLFRDPQAANRMKAASDASQSLIRTLIAFGIMLGLSVIAGVILHLENSSAASRQHHSETESLWITVGLEAIDTVLVVVSLCVIRVQFRGFSRTLGQKTVAWAGFLTLLAGLLLLNVAYHHLLRQIAPVVQIDRHPFGKGDIFWLWGLAICVQPAIIEELFFRYLSLGALRSVAGVHTAVWISAIMFALAHIYTPLSLPVLFCLGVGLGYARVASGGMVLPMFMHFLHNAVIMYLNSQFI